MMKIIHLKNRITDSVRDRIEYWLNESDTYTVAIVMSGVFMFMILSGLLMIMFLVGKQLRLNDNALEKEKVVYDKVHVIRYVCLENPKAVTAPEQRVFYYANYYRDLYSMSDTALIHSDDTDLLYGGLQYVKPVKSSVALKDMLSCKEAGNNV